MNFKDATDRLTENVSHADLARSMDVSIHTIRQARLRPDAAGYRSPPDGWEESLLRIAEERASHYREFIRTIRAQIAPSLHSEDL